MKGFKLDKHGDILIENGNIAVINGEELIRQSCTTVLGTNKKEWFLNEDEGINFKNILVKNPNFDLICDEIRDGLMQIDETFTVEEFDYSIDGRALIISFVAVNDSGDVVRGKREYGK